jgi:cellobiose phosphorylase
MGYTIIASTRSGIHSSTRYFVPLGEDLEVWEMTLTNQRETPANLSVFSAIEFNLWDAMDDATNYQRNYSIGEVEVEDGVIYHKSEYRERRDHYAFLACSEDLAGFETQREVFLGPYRGWEAPAGLACKQLSGSIAHGWQPIGAQQVEARLEPGESHTIIFLLGYQENPQTEKFDKADPTRINKTRIKTTLEKFRQPAEVEAAFEGLRDHWDGLLRKYQVIGPDTHTNRMVNIWNIYQVMMTFNLSRSASYFESGMGRGMGFRDSNQDLLGFMHLDPARARERILDLAATQLPTGGAYHQYQPLTKRGNNGVGSDFNDDPLWLVLAVSAYIKETGDWDILDTPAPYDNQPGSQQPIFDHLQRSLQYTLDRLGPHQLPLIGRADWNDCLNLNAFSDTPGQSFQTTTNKDGKVAESVFIAGLFLLAAKDMIAICERRENIKLTRKYAAAAEAMRTAVWASGWDGEWFKRAYDDFGDPLGSKANVEGRIFIEPQGLCVMAGLGLSDERARLALDSVAEHLATPHGIVLQQPAFSKYYLHLGEISSYPPGYKENAGIFCHSNPWIMIAEAMIGRGDRAFDYYLRINPSAREEISDLHKCEPYVYAQMIAGKDAPTFGEAKNSWLTGTAAWNYVAITQWILGVRPSFEGLVVEPVIPKDWKTVKVEREFRSVRYVINIERVGSGNSVTLNVDGVEVPGTVIPLPGENVRQVNVAARVQ